MIANGITPWVTLYHWDLPSSYNELSSTGGWLNSKVSDYFNDYADFAFKTFGGKVRNWLTLNEPWTYCWEGYGSGNKAPGRCSDDRNPKCKTLGNGGDTSTEPYTCAHNSILAHGKAVQTYRTKYQKDQGGVIGWTANVGMAYPYDPSNPDDVDAVDVNLAFAFGWFVDPIVFGKYPDEMTSRVKDGRLPSFTQSESDMIKGSYDFMGLNHYSSSYVRKVNMTGTAWDTDSGTVGSTTDVNGNVIGPTADSTWLQVVPKGMRGIVNWIDKRYNHPKIYVFENGVSVPDENKLFIYQAVHDTFRVDFYKGYISNLIDAMTLDGVDVGGYFAWSLMDNFEWNDGYRIRFGMVYVDY